MNAELHHPSPHRREDAGREQGVSWLDVGCAWLAVLALGVLSLTL